MAPEVDSGNCTDKVDIYSFVILYEMFEGSDALARQFSCHDSFEDPQFSDRTPSAVREFIRLCVFRDFRCPFLDCLFDHLLAIIREHFELTEEALRDIDGYASHLQLCKYDQELEEEEEEEEGEYDED